MPRDPAIQNKEVILLAEPQWLRTPSLGSWSNFVLVVPLQCVVGQPIIIGRSRQEGLQLCRLQQSQAPLQS